MTQAMADMRARIATGRGFIAALDQSGGSTPKALRLYGIGADSYSDEEAMFALIHSMRCRIISAPCFSGDKLLGAILFERTMEGEVEGQSVPQFLWQRGIVPFLKVDQGLESERDGVQLMKPLDRLAELCGRARDHAMFGTKMRSVIHSANRAGIAAVVDQQCAVAEQIIGYGLTPIIEPEVSIVSESRAECDQILREELTTHLDRFASADKAVLLKLSLPVEDNFYAPLVDHPAVLRVLALSGGFSRAEACAALACNRGMVASFSRALLESLRHDMDDSTFNAVLDESVNAIYKASLAG